jgi:hypothetical protein
MDDDRKIRFQVAPVLFVASLLLGALFDQGARDSIVQFLERPDWGAKLIGIVAGGGVVVFAGGYIIGTCTQFLLRMIFWCKAFLFGGSRFHEVALSNDSLERVWHLIGAPEEPKRSKELFAGAVFDFAILKKDREGVNQWLFRRWNGFNTAANSIFALVLSLLVGPSIGVPWGYWWWQSVLAFAVVLGLTAYWSWREAMNMVGFMASLKSTPKLGDTSGPAGGEASDSGRAD